MRSLDLAWERAKILKEWEKWIERIREAAREVLSSDLVGIYLFGSVIKGELTASSDVDVLIIARIPKSSIRRSEIKGRIEKIAGLPEIHPFEIHIVDEDEAGVYLRHLKEAVRLE
ncbi:MAG: nucleotidyltransferase domain-containing protein [Candidatus Methanodesulfokora sp.]